MQLQVKRKLGVIGLAPTYFPCGGGSCAKLKVGWGEPKETHGAPVSGNLGVCTGCAAC